MGTFDFFIGLALLSTLGLPIIYMLLVKPGGTLTATYQLRAVDEKPCLVGEMKAAAVICRFWAMDSNPIIS